MGGFVDNRFTEVRLELDKFGFRDILTFDSLDLVIHLFTEWKKKTDELERVVEKAEYFHKISQELEEGVEPFKEENVRLIKENCQLRLAVLHTKENAEETILGSKCRLRDLECENVDLKLLVKQFVHRTKALELDLLQKTSKIGLLQGRNSVGVVVISEGTKKNHTGRQQKMEITSQAGFICPHCVRIRNYVEYNKIKDPNMLDYAKLADSRIEALQIQNQKLKSNQTELTDLIESMKNKIEGRDSEIDKLKGLVEVRPGGMKSGSRGDNQVASFDRELHLALKAAQMQLDILQSRNLQLEKKLQTSILQEHAKLMSNAKRSQGIQREMAESLVDLEAAGYPTHDKMTLEEKVHLLEAQLSHCCKDKAKLKLLLEECESQRHHRTTTPIGRSRYDKNKAEPYKVAKPDKDTLTKIRPGSSQGTRTKKNQKLPDRATSVLEKANRFLAHSDTELSESDDNTFDNYSKPDGGTNGLVTVSRKKSSKSRSSSTGTQRPPWKAGLMRPSRPWRNEAQRVRGELEETERLSSEVQRRQAVAVSTPQRKNYDLTNQRFASRGQSLEKEKNSLKSGLKALDRDKDDMRVELDRKDERLDKQQNEIEQYKTDISNIQLRLKNAELQLSHTGDTNREQERGTALYKRQNETIRKDLNTVIKERDDIAHELREGARGELEETKSLVSEVQKRQVVDVSTPQRDNYDTGREQERETAHYKRQNESLRKDLDTMIKERDDIALELRQRPRGELEGTKSLLSEVQKRQVVDVSTPQRDNYDTGREQERETAHYKRQNETLRKDLNTMIKERDDIALEMREGARDELEETERLLSEVQRRQAVAVSTPQRDNYDLTNQLQGFASREQSLEKEKISLKSGLKASDRDKDDMRVELDRKDERLAKQQNEIEQYKTDISNIQLRLKNAELQLSHTEDTNREQERETALYKRQNETLRKDLDTMIKERDDIALELRERPRGELEGTERLLSEVQRRQEVAVSTPQRGNYDLTNQLQRFASREQSLEKEIISLKSGLKSLEREKDEKNTELDRKNDRLGKYQSEIEQYKIDMSKLQLRLKNAEFQLSHSGETSREQGREALLYKRENDNLHRDLETVIKEKDKWRNEAQRARDELEETERLLSEVQRRQADTVSTPQRDNYDLTNQLQRFASREQSLEKEIISLKSGLKALDRDKDDMRVELDRKDERLAKQQNEIEQYKTDISNIQLRLKNAELQLSHTGDTNREQERETALYKRQNETLRKDLDTMIKERDDIALELRRATKNHSLGELERRSISSELDKRNKEAEDLKKQLQKYIDEVRRIEDLLMRKQEEYDGILNQYRALAEEHTSLENDRNNLERTAESIRREAREASGINTTLKSRLTSQSSIVQSYEDEIQKLSEQIATMETQLATLSSSENTVVNELSTTRDLCLKLEAALDKTRLELANTLSANRRLEAENRQSQSQIQTLESELSVQTDRQKRLEEMGSTTRENELAAQRTIQDLTLARDELARNSESLHTRLEALNHEASRYRLKTTELQSELERSHRQLLTEKTERENALAELRRLQDQLNTSSTNILLSTRTDSKGSRSVSPSPQGLASSRIDRYRMTSLDPGGFRDSPINTRPSTEEQGSTELGYSPGQGGATSTPLGMSSRIEDLSRDRRDRDSANY